MPRSIWNGAISFGLVSVPVQLFSATEQKDVRFHQFDEKTGDRIRYQRVAEDTGEEVAYEDIVKGYEVSEDRYVLLTPEELESVEPGKSRTIEIEEFVDLTEIDPVYFEKTYYLAPREDAGAERPYALLREAMARANRVAVGRFVMRTKQYLAAIRASGDLLVLETMFFPDEVRDRADIDVPADVGIGERELRVAEQLVDSLTSPWDPAKYRDTYRERVLELVHRKEKGEEVVVDRRPEERTNVVDLMEALEASVAAARGKGPRRSGGSSRDWDALSRDELYDEAARRGIKGRSRMSKEQLAAALRRAS